MQGIIDAVGWMLIHFLWQGGVIAASLWLALRVNRGGGANARYLWGLMACLAVLLAPLVTLLLLLGQSAPRTPVLTQELPAFGALAIGNTVGSGRWLQAALEPALPVVVALWAAGVLLLSLRTLLGWWGVSRLARVGVAGVGAELEQVLARLQAELGVQRAVRLLRSVKVRVPTVVGWLRPVILLPAGVIIALPREQLELVIAHELAHVRRYDYLVNLLQLVIETLFFYHPAVRWISRQVREERENCCDDMVLRACGQPLVYARTLARLESLRGELPLAPAVAATGGDLFSRVSRIVQREAPRAQSGLAHASLVTLLAIGTGLGARHGLDALASAAVMPAVTFSTWQGSATPGLAALGDGWKRHQGQWSPPDPRTTRRAPEPAVTARPSPVPAARDPAPVAVRSPAPQTPAAWPGRRAVTGVPPRPSREHMLSGLDALVDGQPNVTPLVTVQPQYPELALSEGVDGKVKLRFRVDERGRATDIAVVEATPSHVFDHAAIEALQQWRFQVNPGHDPAALVAQTFDFAWQEVPEPSGRDRSKECLRTGTRICAHPYTEEHITQFRPEGGNSGDG